jgi:putative sterol carrier protein
VPTPTPLPVFSDAWAKACAVAINANPAYRAAAKTWEGAVLLSMSSANEVDDARRVFLDLWHGECRGARSAKAEDETAARFILSGREDGWREVLTGQIAPFLAIMTGKLRVSKGSILELLPYANAAKELVGAAAEVPSTFPGD